LFYTGLDGMLMSVTTELTAPIKVAPPVQVLTTVYYGGITLLSGSVTYDVAPDGRRFLMIKDADDANAVKRAQIVVVRNWREELKRLVPVQRRD